MRFGASTSIVFVVCTSLGGCRREKPPPSEATTPSGAASLAKPSSAAASASVAIPPRSAEDEAAVKTVRAWSDALDRHDLTKLGELYASSVRFYGSSRSKVAVLAAKRGAFAKQPGFRQELIGEISLERSSEGKVFARFVKKAGPPESWLVISATLVLVPSAGGYLVAEEADEETTKREAPSACDGVAVEVVTALPAVKKAMAEAEKDADASDGGASLGGIGPQDDGDGSFSASMGLHYEDHYEPRYSYSVDKNGRLTVFAGGGDVVVPPDALKRVAEACKR